MGTITHKAGRIAVSKVTDVVLKNLDKDREKEILKLVDFIEKYMDGEKLDVDFNNIRKKIEDKDSAINKYINKALDEIDPGVLKTIVLNLGFEAFLNGTKTIRKMREKYDCNVPWLILMDPTSACNLHCTGCWAAEYGNRLNLTYEEMDSVVTQGKELGTYLYMFTGGEPLVRKSDIIKLCEKHNDCAFLSFTNMDVVNQTGAWVPLYIMTSDKNNKDTVEFFEEHNYFGYDKDYVKFFIQSMVPSVDYNGKLYMESTDSLAMSPNGNGGWFLSLIAAGLDKDMRDKGVEYVNVFAVDNILQRIADPAFIGATILAGAECGSKVVRKCEPAEKVGVMCRVNGHPSIIEYYEMSEELASLRREDGELTYGFGVILNYLFSFKKLVEIANRKLPLHIVEKKIPYIDENDNLVKPETPNGYKFEKLVLDMVEMMDNCVPYEVERNYEFAPIKNKTGKDSLESARELLKVNGIEF